MKKKIFALAMTAVMSFSMMLTTMADTNEVSNTIWWDAWTPSYEVADGATVEFDIDVKGGAEIWSNVNTVFVNVPTDGKTEPSAANYTGYKEYYVARGDNYGWGDSKTSVSFEGGIALLDGNDAFKAMMEDAHLDITITKNGNTVVYKYDATGANGTTTTRTATITADTSEGLYVFFTGDAGVSMTVSTEASPAEVSADNPENNTTPAGDGDTTVTEEKTEDDATKKTVTDTSKEVTKAQINTDRHKNDVEGMSPVVIVVLVVVVVVVVVGIAVATRKKE